MLKKLLFIVGAIVAVLAVVWLRRGQKARPSPYDNRSRTEPLVMALRPDDPEIRQCTETAIANLDRFVKAQTEQQYPNGLYMVKAYLPDGSMGLHTWLTVIGCQTGTFTCKATELPSSFSGLANDQTVTLAATALEDWLISDRGTLLGGWSLRAQRSHVPDAERTKFDKYVGISQYGSVGAELDDEWRRRASTQSDKAPGPPPKVELHMIPRLPR